MPKVNSTAIKSVRRTFMGRTRVTFHGHKGGPSRVYVIDAPDNVYRTLRDSRSVGSTYNALVKGQYPTRRIR